MARGSRRHPLVIYREVINRWWPETLTLGIFLAALAWPIYQDPLGQAQSWRWKYMLALGVGTILYSLFLLVMRSKAYVQVFPTYLKLVTPFLRLNISHKRLRRTAITEMQALFPPEKLHGWKRNLIAPLGGRTAVVLELNGWPASPEVLRIFLSRFFFKDKTPHFVILVDDWMRFSTELESLRRGDEATPPRQTRTYDQSILSRLPHKNP
jgi:hypothetical protein